MLVLLLAALSSPARAESFDMPACLQKAELKATKYPRSKDEWRSHCASGTKSCLDSWKKLAVVRQHAEDDYRQLCQHLADSARGAYCDANCLDDALSGSRLALADATRTETDLAELEKAARARRKQNLLYVARLIDRPQGSAAPAPSPRCWWDFRFSLRIASLIWVESARAAGAEGAAPLPSISQPFDKMAAEWTAQDVGLAARNNVGGAQGKTAKSDKPEDPPQVKKENSAATAPGQQLPNGDDSKSPTAGGELKSPDGKLLPEELALEAVSAGKPLPDVGPLRPAVLENLEAAVETWKAVLELQDKQSQLAQDKLSLGKQIAELETRSRNLASAPGETSAQPFASASSDAASAPPSASAAPAADLSPSRGGSPSAAAGAPASPRRSAGPLRAPASLVAAEPNDSAPATANSFNQVSPGSHSDLVLQERPQIPAAKGVSAEAKTGKGAPKTAPIARYKKGTLAEALRRQLSADDLAEGRGTDGHLEPGSAAEGALASMLNGGAPDAAVTAGVKNEESGSRQGLDYSGLVPLSAGRAGESGESQASEFPARDSPGLFERVHSAHQRFETRTTSRHGRSASL